MNAYFDHSAGIVEFKLQDDTVTAKRVEFLGFKVGLSQDSPIPGAPKMLEDQVSVQAVEGNIGGLRH